MWIVKTIDACSKVVLGLMLISSPCAAAYVSEASAGGDDHGF